MQELKSPTRADYMAGKVDHATYYRAVAATAGVSYANANPEFMAEVRAALAAGDEHLNTIALDRWDMRAMSLLPSVGRAFREHGDIPTLGGGVCLVKQAARDAAEVVSRA